MIEEEIRQRLFALQDSEYRHFQCKLMPTVAPETVIGVRTPALRAFAKELAKTPQAAEFISILPHKYYEENNLHGFILETMNDYDALILALDSFLPYVDNWATCDQMSPKVFKKHIPELYEKLKFWIASGKTYTVRFGIEMLMTFYLNENFKPEQLDIVSSVKSAEYYVNMMLAWYFATALYKQYEAVLPVIEAKTLDKWVQNKSIQKAIESYRITPEQKEYLRTLKIK